MKSGGYSYLLIQLASKAGNISLSQPSIEGIACRPHVIGPGHWHYQPFFSIFPNKPVLLIGRSEPRHPILLYLLFRSGVGSAQTLVRPNFHLSLIHLCTNKSKGR